MKGRSVKKNQDLDRRLDGYSRSASALRSIRRGFGSSGARYSAAAAAGAALVGAGSAEAALMTSPNQGFMLSTTQGGAGAGVDIDGDGVDDLNAFVFGSFFTNFPGFSFSSITSSGTGSGSNFGSIYGRVFPAQASSLIGVQGLSFGLLSEFTFRSVSFPYNNPPAIGATFTSTRTRTFGFSFTAGSNTNPGANGPNLGWGQAVFQFGVGVTKLSLPTLVFNTTPSQGIHVGGVPEPASVGLMGLGLLALGARGLREQRRRKKKKS